MKISVIVPSYNRASSLDACLNALAKQTRKAYEIVLVLRPDDLSTTKISEEWSASLPIVVQWTEVPGQVNALNAGLVRACGDILAITDDDAAPREKWLEKIELYFERNAHLGGIGGRDWVHAGVHLREEDPVVGKIQWFGRIVGKHHSGVGPPRLVDFLKGANMSYRRSAVAGVRFDTELRGKGAQVFNDFAFSLAVRRNGWGLLYDPEVDVDHYPATREDNIGRGLFSAEAQEITAFNQYWALLTGLPRGAHRAMVLLYQRLVGIRRMPGHLLMLLGILRGDREAWPRWKAANAGRRQAARHYAQRSGRLQQEKLGPLPECD